MEKLQVINLDIDKDKVLSNDASTYNYYGVSTNTNINRY